MGSLNGDVVVMRNGRSTSQISVYNYPEHLNPFYEEDQHKRLRFWKINKGNNHKERRSSLSIANLKEMWAFKSFRPKKRSSMLGINKTSESPPSLRRELHGNNHWNTLDHRLRHSTNASPLYNDSFQRNNIYRSSLQNIPAGSTNDRIGFNRNDNYRSTIQFSGSNRRYPERSLQIPQRVRRSSQTSMSSTNPFETDNEDDVDGLNVSEVTSITSSIRTPRKKRRAPAPPTPLQINVRGITTPKMLNESSQEQTQEQLCIREENDIANLTAEIETFVQIKNNEDLQEEKLLINKSETTYEKNNNNDDSNKIAEYKVELNSATNKKFNEKNTIEENNAPLQIKETNAKFTAAAAATTTTTTCQNVAHNETKKSKRNEENANKEEIASHKIKKISGEFPAITTTTATNVTHEDELVFNQHHVVDEIKISKDSISKPKDVITKEIYENNTNNQTVQTQSITTIENNAENMINGAIPKKIKLDSDITIHEHKVDSEGKPLKPVPMRRKSKVETEVGQVECIHVHVESPRSIPRHDHPSSVTSFKTKTTGLHTQEKITGKTSFTLVSPPMTRKDLNATSETETTARSETSSKLTISPKSNRTHEYGLNHAITEENDNKINLHLSCKSVKEAGFAEIHKPSRKNRDTKTVTEENINMPSNDHPKQDHPNELQCPDAMMNETMVLDNDLKIIENSPAIIGENIELGDQQRKSSFDVDKIEFDALYRPKPSSPLEWKKSTLAPLETNIPPEKRKSVKEIIASINRSQRLLHQAANKDFPAWPDHHVDTVSESLSKIDQESNNNNLQENLKILDEREREIKRMVEEIDSMRISTKDTITEQVQRDAQKLDNNDIFQKCTVTKEVYDYRESSPISSNLDWNPLPKPKRIKPLHE